MQSAKKLALLDQDSGVKKEAFVNLEVYTDASEIIHLLENCLKISNECIYESVGSITGNHISNRTIKIR